MTIDTSAWKINDPEWVKQREEKWPTFEAWLIDNYSSDKDRSIDGSLKSAKLFFQNGVLDKTIEDHGSSSVGFEAAIALYPLLNPDDVKKIIDFYCVYGRRGDLKGHFRQYYLSGFRYEVLINKGALPKDFMLQFLKGAYGNSLAEAAQILEFEVEKVCYRVVNDMGPIIFNYYFNNLKTLDFQTANHLIPIHIDALKLLNDGDARNCDFVFSQHVKRKRKYYDAGLVSDPDRLAIMNRMLAEIKKVWNELNPIVQEKLWPLVE